MRLLGGRLAAVLCALLLTAPATRASARAVFSYADEAALLSRFVDPAGHVDYAAILRSPSLLRRVAAEFARTSPENHPDLFPTRADSLAYWINAYNVFVIEGVTRHWPATTVRSDSNAFFTQERFQAGGREYTLDQIESDIIRKVFAEPRIHFTINCGAVSCPVLTPKPFTGADLDARLDQAARLFINDPEHGVRIDTTAAVVDLSEIFHWYESDFFAALRRKGVSEPTIMDYVAPYLDSSARATLAERRYTIRYVPYDWTLNATTLPVR